jgi:hypothetical protein
MKYIRLYEEYRGTKCFIWIHGLPGSGKSHLARALALNEDGTVQILDDTASLEEVRAGIQDHGTVIFSSPYFEEYLGLRGMTNRLLTLLNNLEVRIEEWWFENDPQACIKNLLKRGEDHAIGSRNILAEIMDFSKRYVIPEGARTVPVWRDK